MCLCKQDTFDDTQKNQPYHKNVSQISVRSSGFTPSTCWYTHDNNPNARQKVDRQWKGFQKFPHHPVPPQTIPPLPLPLLGGSKTQSPISISSVDTDQQHAAGDQEDDEQHDQCHQSAIIKLFPSPQGRIGQALNLPCIMNVNPRSIYNKINEVHTFVREAEFDCVLMSKSWEWPNQP